MLALGLAAAIGLSAGMEQSGTLSGAKLIFLPAPPEIRSAHVEAVVRLDRPDLRMQTAWRVFGQLAEQHGSRRHSRGTLLRLLNGRQPRVFVFPDHVRISVAAPMGGEANALSVMYGLLNEPIQDAKAYAEVEGEVRAGTIPSGYARLWQDVRDDRPLPYDEMVANVRNSARPGRVTICVQGRGPFDQVERSWRGFERDWPAVDRETRRLPAKPVRIARGSGEPGVVWIGPERSASGTTLIDVAAAMAIGAGKDATLYRVARRANRVAYTPIVIWQPTESGWRTVVWLDRSRPLDPEAQAKLVRGVTEDLDAWNEGRIAHVRGMMRVVFERRVPYSPFLMTESTTFGGHESDSAYWTAYWWAKTGELWDLAPLQRLLAGVSVDAIRDSARRQLGLVDGGKYEFRVFGEELGMGGSAER
ncbi:MAG: hypothetical protein SFX74_00785 [Fimbriimonadaceae bacterium]|nr:hypothetical protein [Fimbriimonadaceae bacterium]